MSGLYQVAIAGGGAEGGVTLPLRGTWHRSLTEPPRPPSLGDLCGEGALGGERQRPVRTQPEVRTRRGFAAWVQLTQEPLSPQFPAA